MRDPGGENLHDGLEGVLGAILTQIGALSKVSRLLAGSGMQQDLIAVQSTLRLNIIMSIPGQPVAYMLLVIKGGEQQPGPNLLKCKAHVLDLKRGRVDSEGVDDMQHFYISPLWPKALEV